MRTDRDWWRLDGGEHYRELAEWLRDAARKCWVCEPAVANSQMPLTDRFDVFWTVAAAHRRVIYRHWLRQGRCHEGKARL